MATRCSQYHANFLAGPVRWYECETATGRPRQHLQTNGLLALMDRVSLLNGSQPVREMPMSLLVCTAWTSPNVWIRTAYCSATFSATLSCLTSMVPTQPLQTCQAARWPIHASATITCSTLLPTSGALHTSSVFFRDLSFQVEKWVQSEFTSCRCLPQQE